MNLNKQTGFTLIELLVVVAIIGLLTSVIAVGFGNARLRARDAKRLSDMKQVRTGMDLHLNQGSGYPNPATWATGFLTCNGVHVMDVPKDPILGVYYIYTAEDPTTGCGGTIYKNYKVEFTTEGNTDIGPPGTYYLSTLGITTTAPF